MIFQGKDGVLRITDNHQDTTNYLRVRFRNMDFSSQLGRPALEERLVLDTGKVNECSHYVTGNDMVIYDPFGLSFSFMMDTTCNRDPQGSGRDLVYEALICRNANNFGASPAQTWAGYGNSTKGTTENKPGTPNPEFTEKIGKTPYATGTVTAAFANDILISESYLLNYLANGVAKFTSGIYTGQEFLVDWNEPDSNTLVAFKGIDHSTIGIGDTFEVWENYRTVDIQFKLDNGLGTPIVWKFNEVYFPPNEIILAESEESINVTATGGVYGTVQRGTDWI